MNPVFDRPCKKSLIAALLLLAGPGFVAVREATRYHGSCFGELADALVSYSLGGLFCFAGAILAYAGLRGYIQNFWSWLIVALATVVAIPLILIVAIWVDFVTE